MPHNVRNTRREGGRASGVWPVAYGHRGNTGRQTRRWAAAWVCRNGERLIERERARRPGGNLRPRAWDSGVDCHEESGVELLYTVSRWGMVSPPTYQGPRSGHAAGLYGLAQLPHFSYRLPTCARWCASESSPGTSLSSCQPPRALRWPASFGGRWPIGHWGKGRLDWDRTQSRVSCQVHTSPVAPRPPLRHCAAGWP